MPDTEKDINKGGDSDCGRQGDSGHDSQRDAERERDRDGNDRKDQKDQIVLCPYCGHVQTATERCEECTGLFEPLSRKATQISMGPWYVRDKKSPFRPGCSYEVLVSLIKKGRIKSTTVLRGPTTRQFWSVARNVPGVSHLLGYCHSCGAHCDPEARVCPKCREPFLPVRERNELGLVYRSEAEAHAAQASLEREMDTMFGEAEKKKSKIKPLEPLPGGSIEAGPGGGMGTGSGIGAAGASGAAAGGDLLSQVLGPVKSPGEVRTSRSTSAGMSLGASPQAPSSAEASPFGPKPTTSPYAAAPAQPSKRSPALATASNDYSAAPSSRAAHGITPDFAPSDYSDGRDELAASTAATPRGGLSTIGWLLVGLNVLILTTVLIVVLYAVFSRSGATTPPNDGNNPTPDNSNAPPAPTGASSGGNIVGHWVALDRNDVEEAHYFFNPDSVTRIMPGEAGPMTGRRFIQPYTALQREGNELLITLPQADGETWIFLIDSSGQQARVTRRAANGTTIGSDVILRYLNKQENPPPPEAIAKLTPDTTETAPTTSPEAEEFDQKLAEVRHLEQSQKYEQALALLNGLASQAPDPQRQKQHTIAVQRVQDKIARKIAIDFFGVPVD